MMRWLGVVLLLAGCSATQQTAGRAPPCDVAIQKVETRLQRVLDPGRRQVVEALLEEARRALTLRQADRCQIDVKKANQALRV